MRPVTISYQEHEGKKERCIRHGSGSICFLPDFYDSDCSQLKAKTCPFAPDPCELMTYDITDCPLHFREQKWPHNFKNKDEMTNWLLHKENENKNT